MHSFISVAVPSRHRNITLRRFMESYWNSLDHLKHKYPLINILHDAPDLLTHDVSVYNTDEEAYEVSEIMRSVYLPDKSSLTELWNWSIMIAPTDWVLICNDDVTFNKGWLEYLEEQIATDKYDIIHLFHYGGMCLHKRLILKLGWFDENFRGGGFEDIDHQIRINEAGIKNRVDRSCDKPIKNGKNEYGKFMNHHKNVSDNGSWDGKNNSEWMCKKWGRLSPWDYRIPSFRKYPEIDWHPTYTSKYAEKYKIYPTFKNSMQYINGEERYL